MTTHRFTSAYQASIDESAEREAIAIEEICDMLDQPIPMCRIAQLREEAAEAARLGLPAPRKWQYNSSRAAKAWLRIVKAYRDGKSIQLKRNLPCVAELRITLQRRLNRAARLLELKRSYGSSTECLPVAHAAKAVGIGERTLHRAIQHGIVKARRADGPTGRAVVVRGRQLRIAAAARALGMRERTLHRAVSKGRIASERIGGGAMVELKEVVRWLGTHPRWRVPHKVTV